jgi:hypothetical protein
MPEGPSRADQLNKAFREEQEMLDQLAGRLFPRRGSISVKDLSGEGVFEGVEFSSDEIFSSDLQHFALNSDQRLNYFQQEYPDGFPLKNEGGVFLKWGAILGREVQAMRLTGKPLPTLMREGGLPPSMVWAVIQRTGAPDKVSGGVARESDDAILSILRQRGWLVGSEEPAGVSKRQSESNETNEIENEYDGISRELEQRMRAQGQPNANVTTDDLRSLKTFIDKKIRTFGSQVREGDLNHFKLTSRERLEYFNKKFPKGFPIRTHSGNGVYGYVRWDVILNHELQLIVNTTQPIPTLLRRGGVTPDELRAALADKELREVDRKNDEDTVKEFQEKGFFL